MTIAVEIDLRQCSLTFSEGACTATGTQCWNTRATCRDIPNFTPETAILRLRMQTGEPLLAADRPYLLSLEHTSQRLTPDGLSDLGDRIDLSIQDAPALDDDDRYNRQSGGTWWAKLLARHRYIVGRPARVIIDGETTHWEVGSVAYPDAQGVGRILLHSPSARLLDTLIPASPAQELRAATDNLTAIAEAALPEDAATGDYFRVGSEIVRVQASGEAERAQFGTDVQTHAEGEEVQKCLVFNPINLPTLLHSLIVLAGGEPFVRLADFQAEEAAGLNTRRLSGLVIAEPTSLGELLAGLLPLGPMTIHWDASAGRLMPRAQTPWTADIREIQPEEIVHFVDGNRQLPVAVLRSDLHATRVYVRYGKQSPVESELLGTAAHVDLEAEGVELYGRNYDRLFEAPLLMLSDRQLAESAAQRILRRRSSPMRQPVEIAFAMSQADNLPRIGQVADICLPDTLQTAAGDPEVTRCQIISARRRPAKGLTEYRALSYRPDTAIAAPLALNIAGEVAGYDLFVEAGEPMLPIRIVLTLSGGARIFGAAEGGTALSGRGFHPDSEIQIVMGLGTQIRGGGGRGGQDRTVSQFGFPPAGGEGQAGGAALDLGLGNWSIEGIGTIAGGGGGGSGGAAALGYSGEGFLRGIVQAGGGGGAGRPGGSPGDSSSTGSEDRPARAGTIFFGGQGARRSFQATSPSAQLPPSSVGGGSGGNPGAPGGGALGGAGGPAVRRQTGAVVVISAFVQVAGTIE